MVAPCRRGGAGDLTITSPSSGGMRLSERQHIDWLRLIRSRQCRAAHLPLAGQPLRSAEAALTACPTSARRGGATRTGRICTTAEAERELERGRAIGVTMVAPASAAIRPRLALTEDAPPHARVRGAIAVMARPMIAIVGSRQTPPAPASSNPKCWRMTSATPVRRRLGAGARHRSRRPSRQLKQRHGGGAGRPARPHLSAGA